MWLRNIKYSSGAHTGANAHGNHAAAGPSTPEFVDERGNLSGDGGIAAEIQWSAILLGHCDHNTRAIAVVKHRPNLS